MLFCRSRFYMRLFCRFSIPVYFWQIFDFMRWFWQISFHPFFWQILTSISPFSFSSHGSEGDDPVQSLEAKLEQCRLELAKEKVSDAFVCYPFGLSHHSNVVHI